MPAVPVPAATVILLRDGPISPELLMLERHSNSVFLPDMYVFPGGRLEDQDHGLAEHMTGFTADQARAALPMVEEELALGFFAAAIRETFEECGILLARRLGEPKLIDAAGATALARHRLEVQEGTTSFRELIEKEKLDLAADLLEVHAHWITPDTSQHRYDTIFFSALAPKGHLALHDGIESTSHFWTRPEDALERRARQELRLIFPTACNLETLAGFENAEAALEASRKREVVTVLPVVRERDGESRLTIPGNAGYATTEEPYGAGR
jgi:8-oxo-dGTP pyrophosphatase MutT (NUDIX family)